MVLNGRTQYELDGVLEQTLFFLLTSTGAKKTATIIVLDEEHLLDQLTTREVLERKGPKHRKVYAARTNVELYPYSNL